MENDFQQILPFHIGAFLLVDTDGMNTVKLMGQTSGLPKTHMWVKQTMIIVSFHPVEMPGKYHSSVVCMSYSLLQVLQSSCIEKRVLTTNRLSMCKLNQLAFSRCTQPEIVGQYVSLEQEQLRLRSQKQLVGIIYCSLAWQVHIVNLFR